MAGGEESAASIAPAAEEKSTADSTPAAEEKFTVDSTPAADEKPSADSTPAADEKPTSDSTPAVDEDSKGPVVVDDAGASRTPAADEESPADSTPPAVEESTSNSTPDPAAAKALEDSKGPAAVENAAMPESIKTSAKKQWGDEDYEDEVGLTTMLDGLKVGSEGGVVDKPDISLAPNTLNEAVEAPETEIRKVLAENTPYTSAKSFEDLNLSESLLRGIYSEMKFEKPSRIQAETLPLILTPPYQNLIAQAHNGSGKTTCFVLGMLSRVNPAVKAPQALCVCPTRELAIQNEEVLLKMGKFTGITSACTASADTAGVSSSRRDKIVDQVIIGTPGTLKRWMTKDKTLNTRAINVLVFDEADHMLDQDGFQDDSLRILHNIKQSKGVSGSVQILLFSATFSDKVKNFAMKIVPKANFIFVEREKLSLDVIKQYRVKCPSVYDKVEVLKDRIFPAAEKLGQSIIFARTRQSASELHKKLEQDGFKCTSIQGGLSHEDRDRVIREFRSGETKILIATDVLARGFDQAQVTLVVNFDIPTKSAEAHEPDYELYLHRIGRSGRFGRKGAAFNLCANDRDERNVDLISRHFNRPIPEGVTAVLNLQRKTEQDNWGIDGEAIERLAREKGLVVVNCPIRDVDAVDLRRKLPFAVGVLYRLLRKGHRVYVTCTTGLDRSPACVIAYLHWIQESALQDAVDQIKKLHPCGPDRPAVVWATWDLVAMAEKENHKGPPTHAVQFVWNHGCRDGEEVLLVGEFKGGWNEPIKAVPASGPKYTVDLRLPLGKYNYKFIVGGHWRHSGSLPTEGDQWGNINNVIKIGEVATTKFDSPHRPHRKVSLPRLSSERMSGDLLKVSLTARKVFDGNPELSSHNEAVFNIAVDCTCEMHRPYHVQEQEKFS